MSDIRQELASLQDARLTPALLEALDYVVPGEWENDLTLDAIIRRQLGVTDAAEVARIEERAVALYAAEPHYARAVKIYRAADSVDKVAAAAVLAKQVGSTFQVFQILDKFTPKAETTQAIDAALKLAAEIAAFATLRGIPVTSLAEAQAFPATLATYARADMMRLAAWIALDGIVPLGPQFVQKIIDVVGSVDTGKLTDNALFAQLKGVLPGVTADEQKGFVLGSLASAKGYLDGFVQARGITQAGISSKLGTLMNVADGGADILAATLDATTNYFEHTGIQSVARVLVHDAQQSLADGEAQPIAGSAAAAEADSGMSRWMKAAAAVTATAGVGVAVGAMLYKGWGDDDEDDDPDGEVDADIENLDDNALAAHEAALEMEARELQRRGGGTDADRQRIMRRRRMIRRMRRRRMMAQGRGGGMGGRGGMGPRGGGMGPRGGGGGGGGRGGGMGPRGGGGGGRGMGGGGGRRGRR